MEYYKIVEMAEYSTFNILKNKSLAVQTKWAVLPMFEKNNCHN